MRWLHPSRGLVSPATLVPLAEQSGTITAIGRWVLEQACQGSISAAAGALPVSANVSAYQVMSSNFAATVEDVLLSTHIDPGLVTLEVTESVFLQDSQRALVVLRDLKRLGVTLALDDFGTGYSSLSYLKRFPVDVVKIDRGSSPISGRTTPPVPLCRRLWTSPTPWGSPWSPKESRLSGNTRRSKTWAVRPARATTSPVPCRSTPWTP